MHALRYQDPAEFAPVARRLIDEQPASCSVLASNLQLHLSGWKRGGPACWFAVMDGDRPIGLAMHTPPLHLFMSPLAAGGDERLRAVDELVAVVGAGGEPPSGVQGPALESALFAQAWCRDRSFRPVPGGEEVLYELDEPPPAPPVPGRMRAAAEDDTWVLDWMRDFHAEALPDRPAPQPEKEFRRRLSLGVLVIWEDDGRGEGVGDGGAGGERVRDGGTGGGTGPRPVAMAGVTLTDPALSRIGPVYVPSADRGRGYGKAVTAAAARLAFDRGAGAVSLYADTANPTSNAVYRGLGFQPVSTWKAFGFSPATDGLPGPRDGS